MNLASDQPLSDFDEHGFLNIYASSEVAENAFPLVWPTNCARSWLPGSSRLPPSTAYTSWVPHGGGLSLSGIYHPEPVWPADRYPPPSATRGLNETNTGFSRRPFFLPEQDISRDVLHFWQPPALHRPSVYGEETPTGTLMPCSVHTVTPPRTLGGPPRQILTNRIQETALFPSCEPNFAFAHHESLLEHQRACRDKKEEVTATCKAAPLVRDIHHEACSLQYFSPGIRDKNVTAALATVDGDQNGYNQDWSPWDMIAFNGFLRDEAEVVCQWAERTTFCSDRVKGKDYTAHLQHRHRITSNSQRYSCLWHECSTSQPMLKSSLERHVKEQHFPVQWACPTCTRTFTRKTTLMGHFKQCPGHVQISVPYTR